MHCVRRLGTEWLAKTDRGLEICAWKLTTNQFLLPPRPRPTGSSQLRLRYRTFFEPAPKILCWPNWGPLPWLEAQLRTRRRSCPLKRDRDALHMPRWNHWPRNINLRCAHERNGTPTGRRDSRSAWSIFSKLLFVVSDLICFYWKLRRFNCVWKQCLTSIFVIHSKLFLTCLAVSFSLRLILLRSLLFAQVVVLDIEIILLYEPK